MACKEWEEKLMDLILEELPAEEARALELHVASCAKCAHALSELKELRGVVKQHLTDRQMPAHLVVIPEKPVSAPFTFLATSWGAAALGGALAAVFLVGLIFGGLWGRTRGPFVRTQVAENTLTRAEVEALVAQEVSDKLSQQKADFQMQNAKLSASLRQEQAQSLNHLAQHMEYLQSAQDLIWKETQSQNALVELIARNSLGETKPSPAVHPE
jgi:anti-sigma factor RsiW